MKRYYPFMIGIGCFLVLMIGVNVAINRSLRSGDVQDSIKSLASARLPQPKDIFSRVPRDRESGAGLGDEAYGVLIPDEERTLTAWNIQMEQILGSAQAQYQMEQSGTFDRARHTDEQYTKKMRWLNVRIRECERLARLGHDRRQAEQQLQQLYMLRSSLQSVRDIVTP